MFEAFDQESNFYYYGATEPTSSTYADLLSTASLIACDIETISLRDRMPLGIGIATDPYHAFYFPLFPNETSALPLFLLQNPQVTKVFHNAIFDLFCMRAYELDMTNIMDTNVMSRLLCYRNNDLSSLSIVHGMEVHDAGVMLKSAGASNMMELDPAIVAHKCMQDCMATYKLYREFLPRVNPIYVREEMEIIPILTEMSWRGIKIDQEYRQKLDDRLSEQVDFLRGLCTDNWGMNPHSSQQVGYILAKEGAYRIFNKLPFTKDKYGKRTNHLSTGKETLEKMDNPIASLVLEARSKANFLNSYIRPWGSVERATTRFHLDAATGRPSSTERNMQNIPPGEMRGCLIPDSGIFTDTDFAQLELRVLAHITEDREMKYIFSLPRYLADGKPNPEADLHQQTADALGIGRKIAKNVNFAIVYGAGIETVMETANIRNRDAAKRLMDSWSRKFPQAYDTMQGWQADSSDRIVTLGGREILLPDEEMGWSHIQSCKVNYRIQGSAAEILKKSLRALQHLDMALTVHDEILADGMVKKDYLISTLEHISEVYTPIEIRYMTQWQ